MVGLDRFELSNDGVKVRCLTSWLYPIICPKQFNLLPLFYTAFILYQIYLQIARPQLVILQFINKNICYVPQVSLRIFSKTISDCSGCSDCSGYSGSGSC